MNNDSTKFSVGVTPSFIKIIFEVLEMFLENRLVDEIAGISRMFFRIASKKKTGFLADSYFTVLFQNITPCCRWAFT